MRDDDLTSSPSGNGCHTKAAWLHGWKTLRPWEKAEADHHVNRRRRCPGGSACERAADYFGSCGDALFFAATGGLTAATEGLLFAAGGAATCAGKYFATMAGSSEANSVSGNRNQVSSLPSSEIPQ